MTKMTASILSIAARDARLKESWLREHVFTIHKNRYGRPELVVRLVPGEDAVADGSDPWRLRVPLTHVILAAVDFDGDEYIYYDRYDARICCYDDGAP